MAEIAIPVAVLGAIYIISNNNKKEGFQNKLKTQETVENYPVEKKKRFVE